MRFVNPTVIIEILSKSTERYDRTDEFEYYRSLPSVQEILFIWQNEQFIEIYRRQSNGWLIQDISGTEGVLSLGSVQVPLTLDDLSTPDAERLFHYSL